MRGVTRNLSEIISYSEVSDPPGVAESMFKTSDPRPIEELACGACELTRTSRGEYTKTIKKNKGTSCDGLKYKYHINSFQITGSNKEEEDDDDSPAT